MIKLTTIKSQQAHKLYKLNNQNQIKSKGQSLYSGTAQVIKLNSLKEILQYVNRDIALVHGIPLESLRCRAKPFNITALEHEDISTRQIARAKKNFVYADETIVLLDIDDLADANYQFTNINNLLDDLAKLFPILKDKEVLAIPSSSNGLSDSRTNKLLNPKSNEKWHIYYRINGCLIPKFKQYLNDLAWVKGHGYAFVSKSGAVYDRCMIDTAVFSSERLDYIGSIDDRTSFIIENKPDAIYRSGNAITHVPASDLSEFSYELFTKERQSKSIKQLVYTKTVKWYRKRVKQGKESLTISEIKQKARAKAEQVAQYEVLPDSELISLKGKKVSVGYISDNLKLLIGQYCADPISEEECKCKIIAAPHANHGFMLKSYKTDGFYCFGSMPKLITKIEITKGKRQQLERYVEKAGSKLKAICTWKQAALIDNKWVNFYDKFSGVFSVSDILKARENKQSKSLRVMQNSLQLMEYIHDYFEPTYYSLNIDSSIPKVVCLEGNAGCAKSFAAKVASEKAGCSSVFITNTIENVDEYWRYFAKGCIRIEGFTNVLWQKLQDEYGHSETDKAKYDADIKHHYQEQLLSLCESLGHWFIDKDTKYRKKRKQSKTLLERRQSMVLGRCFAEFEWQSKTDIEHQMMTLAKAKKDLRNLKKRINEQLKQGKPVVVFLDEMDAMKANPQSGVVTAYEHFKDEELVGYDQPSSADVEQAALMDYLYQKEGVFVVLMSAERGISKALHSKGIKHHYLNRVNVLLDNDLELTYVKSTSKKITNGRSSLLENIVKIKDKWPQHALVVNGLNDQQKQTLANQGVTTYTHEGLKGHNDKKNTNFVSIINYPHPSEIQKYLLSIGIDDNNKKAGDEAEAISTLVSNRFNQTIGRNTGYRDDYDSKHIALIPNGLKGLIKSDVLTVNHSEFDDVTKGYEDPEMLLELIKADMDEYKAENGLDILETTRRFIRNTFIKPATDSWNLAQSNKVKANDIASKLFGNIVKCKKTRVDGVPKDICLY